MKQHTVIGALIALCVASCAPQGPQSLTILHTNDTHSQVEPTSKLASKNANLGGYARRMGLIKQEREADPDLILLDAGDFSQGTPYFNFYRGRIEMEAMNRMHYDAGTLGNHEFDNGLDTLAMILRMAEHPIVCANYDATGTILEGLIRPYTIIRRKGMKIGVIGLSVNPVGLIAMRNFEPLRYLEPLPELNKYAEQLKKKEKCDLIICLSHVGTDASELSDIELIPQTHDVDIFIGGHTHHVYDGERVMNADGREVVVSQMGKSGLRVGKMQVILE